MRAFVIWYISWVQRERFYSMNGFRVEATDNFGFDNLLHPSQGRRCYRLDPDRLVVQTDTEKRRFAVLYCVSQGQSDFVINIYIIVLLHVLI